MNESSTSSTGADRGATLGEDFGRAFITLTHETLTAAADALGDLDRRAGDGDFGTNVRTAMKGAAISPAAIGAIHTAAWKPATAAATIASPSSRCAR